MKIENEIGKTINIKKLYADEKHKGVGLEIYNCIGCDIYIEEIKDFEVGVLLSSDSSPGCVHNRIFIKRLVNNKHNLDLVQSQEGWVNQNLFLGGQLAHYSPKSGNPPDSPEFSQIRLIQEEGSLYGAPDNNFFLNVSVEGAIAKYFVECEGSHNIFDNLRYERGFGVKPHRVKFQGERNTLRGGFDADKLEVEGDMPILESMPLLDKLKIKLRSLF